MRWKCRGWLIPYLELEPPNDENASHMGSWSSTLLAPCPPSFSQDSSWTIVNRAGSLSLQRKKLRRQFKRGFRRTNVKKLTVLIVDDSSVMRKIVERALRQGGLDIGEVREASNGAEGLVEAQKGSLDIILSDINMPVMDGLEFLKNLSAVESAKGVPVVMITTEGSEARVVEALSAGAKGYLRKPFTPEQVKERVAPLLVGVL